jgi:choline dehydrogenase-like flavoprotein
LAIGWAAPDGIVEENSPYLQTLYRFTAPGSNLQNDMQSMLFQALPQPALNLRVMLLKPFSRGSLKLQSAEPTGAPHIRLNLTSAPEDARRMRDGVRLLGKILRLPTMIALGTTAFTLADATTMSSDDLQRCLADDQWVTDYVRRGVTHYVHPVGSCRMGLATDPHAVVDQHGRVHGISNLRVADASVMPTIPRANTNFPTIMIAERIANWMRQETD